MLKSFLVSELKAFEDIIEINSLWGLVWKCFICKIYRHRYILSHKLNSQVQCILIFFGCQKAQSPIFYTRAEFYEALFFHKIINCISQGSLEK